MNQLYPTGSTTPRDDWKTWQDISRREFYDGDLEVGSADRSELRFDKSLSYPISLTQLRSNGTLSYRRSSKHIRGNRVGFRVLWFVKKGSLKVVRANGVCTIEASEGGIIDSNVPFSAVIQCDDQGEHESYQAIIPPDLFFGHLRDAEKFAGTFRLDTPDGELIRRLLAILIENGEQVSRQAAKPLVDALLEAVADSLRSQNVKLPARERVIDRRLMDIENYILMNLTDPDLCYDRVALNCGISPRYLCYVLKANNTCFSDLVWKNRLPKARDWLVAANTRDYPINEIAFMSGFKSAAHFSRMFRATYGCSPREYRTLHLDPQDNKKDDEVNDISWHGTMQREAA